MRSACSDLTNVRPQIRGKRKRPLKSPTSAASFSLSSLSSSLHSLSSSHPLSSSSTVIHSLSPQSSSSLSSQVSISSQSTQTSVTPTLSSHKRLKRQNNGGFYPIGGGGDHGDVGAVNDAGSSLPLTKSSSTDISPTLGGPAQSLLSSSLPSCPSSLQPSLISKPSFLTSFFSSSSFSSLLSAPTSSKATSTASPIKASTKSSAPIWMAPHLSRPPNCRQGQHQCIPHFSGPTPSHSSSLSPLHTPSKSSLPMSSHSSRSLLPSSSATPSSSLTATSSLTLSSSLPSATCISSLIPHGEAGAKVVEERRNRSLIVTTMAASVSFQHESIHKPRKGEKREHQEQRSHTCDDRHDYHDKNGGCKGHDADATIVSVEEDCIDENSLKNGPRNCDHARNARGIPGLASTGGKKDERNIGGVDRIKSSKNCRRKIGENLNHQITTTAPSTIDHHHYQPCHHYIDCDDGVGPSLFVDQDGCNEKQHPNDPGCSCHQHTTQHHQHTGQHHQPATHLHQPATHIYQHTTQHHQHNHKNESHQYLRREDDREVESSSLSSLSEASSLSDASSFSHLHYIIHNPLKCLGPLLPLRKKKRKLKGEEASVKEGKKKGAAVPRLFSLPKQRKGPRPLELGVPLSAKAFAPPSSSVEPSTAQSSFAPQSLSQSSVSSSYASKAPKGSAEEAQEGVGDGHGHQSYHGSRDGGDGEGGCSQNRCIIVNKCIQDCSSNGGSSSHMAERAAFDGSGAATGGDTTDGSAAEYSTTISGDVVKNHVAQAPRRAKDASKSLQPHVDHHSHLNIVDNKHHENQEPVESRFKRHLHDDTSCIRDSRVLSPAESICSCCSSLRATVTGESSPSDMPRKLSRNDVLLPPSESRGTVNSALSQTLGAGRSSTSLSISPSPLTSSSSPDSSSVASSSLSSSSAPSSSVSSSPVSSSSVSLSSLSLSSLSLTSASSSSASPSSASSSSASPSSASSSSDSSSPAEASPRQILSNEDRKNERVSIDKERNNECVPMDKERKNESVSMITERKDESVSKSSSPCAPPSSLPLSSPKRFMSMIIQWLKCPDNRKTYDMIYKSHQHDFFSYYYRLHSRFDFVYLHERFRDGLVANALDKRSMRRRQISRMIVSRGEGFPHSSFSSSSPISPKSSPVSASKSSFLSSSSLMSPSSISSSPIPLSSIPSSAVPSSSIPSSSSSSLSALAEADFRERRAQVIDKIFSIAVEMRELMKNHPEDLSRSTVQLAISLFDRAHCFDRIPTNVLLVRICASLCLLTALQFETPNSHRIELHLRRRIKIDRMVKKNLNCSYETLQQRLLECVGQSVSVPLGIDFAHYYLHKHGFSPPLQIINRSMNRNLEKDNDHQHQQHHQNHQDGSHYQQQRRHQENQNHHQQLNSVSTAKLASLSTSTSCPCASSSAFECWPPFSQSSSPLGSSSSPLPSSASPAVSTLSSIGWDERSRNLYSPEIQLISYLLDCFSLTADAANTSSSLAAASAIFLAKRISYPMVPLKYLWAPQMEETTGYYRQQMKNVTHSLCQFLYSMPSFRFKGISRLHEKGWGSVVWENAQVRKNA